MTRVGIVGGTGFMGHVHTRAARDAGASVVAVTGSSAASAAQAAEALSIPAAVASLPELLALDVDIVHVCSPNALHTEHALAAIEAGKHVVCEKPLATSAADARRLRDAAAAAGVVATVPFVYRFHPMAREARARVEAAGRIATVQGQYLQDWLLDPSDDNWRVDASTGGPSRAFADIGSHLVDLLEFVSGQRVRRLHAATRTFHPLRGGRSVSSEDAVALLVELDDGAVGSLLVSQVAAGHSNGLVVEIAAEREAVRFSQENPDTLWVGQRAASLTVPRAAENLSPDAARLSVVPPGHPMGYPDAFAAFCRDTYALTRGEQPVGLPTFDDGVRAAVVTEAVLRSAREHGWVDVTTKEEPS